MRAEKQQEPDSVECAVELVLVQQLLTHLTQLPG